MKQMMAETGPPSQADTLAGMLALGTERHADGDKQGAQEAFARAVLEDARVYECSARENLLNQAVIEAIYLSDKTSQPESPSRLLKTYRLSAEQCLRYQPRELGTLEG